MGLAVLPARLKGEIRTIKEKLISGESISNDALVSKHAAWVDSFKDKYVFTEENADEILQAEIGKTFVDVLFDAGVYKDTIEGRAAFLKFLKSLDIVNN